MKINDSHKKLIAHISLECIKNGVTLILSNSRGVKFIDEPDHLRSRGFFDEDSRMLAIGTKNPIKIWFPILLHEFNHMQQWIEGKYDSVKYVDAGYYIWDWLDRKLELNDYKLKKSFDLVREYEKDCEIRTWNMIRENPLVDDPNRYIKHANAYLYFYTIARRLRKWYKKPPYAMKDVLDTMPVKFMNDYNKVPKDYQKLVIEKCF